MTHGTIQTWEVQVGEKVDEGDQLASMETDKTTMALESPESGFMAKILIPAGTKNIPIKDPICVLVDDESDISAFADFVPQSSSPKEVESPPSEAPDKASSPVVESSAKSSTEFSGRVTASPLARRLAKEKGVDIQTLDSHKNDGIIRKEDVLKAQTAPSSPISHVALPIEQSDYTDILLSNIREIISARLLHSKQTIPHFYLSIDVRMDDMMSLRKRLNNQSPTKLSVNDLTIKASVLSCLRHPEVNSAFHGSFIRQFNHVDVCIAVDTPDGLITPIVRRGETLGLVSISQTVKSLVEKAKDRKLRPDEFQGGTFTISNLGMFGIDQFCAIINPPQSSILAVGTIRESVVVDESNESGYGVGQFMTVTLSCDHRVVDGAVGARWLAHFKKLMERPELMLL